MFFDVYFFRAQKFLVIPVKWVKNYQIVVQKFMNYSVNTTQTHRCYFSENLNENGETERDPDFCAPIADDIPANGDCCFFACVVKYFCKYFS